MTKQKTRSNLSVQYMTRIAILGALSAVLFPLEIPIVAFYKLDFSTLPALLGAFSMGPLPGLAILLIKDLSRLAYSSSMYVGELADFIMSAAFILPASLIYRKHKTRKTALVGMAGVMSGVMNAPLTSIFLIAELSNGYGLFIPLMITACISFAVDYYLDPDSIYTKQLRQKGELLTHDKDQSVFVFLKLEELMETDFLRIKENMTLGDIVHIISTARRNIFPVIDNFGRLLGVVQLDDLREDMFKPEKYGRPISDYMIQPPDKILEHESIMSVMEKFEDKHTWMLPVVDKKNRYLGFISKSRILNAYREQLVKIQQ